jgi:serine acetyltransferase
MLAHGEIIVGAPHRDRLGAVVAGKAARVGIGALVAQDVDENAITTFGMQAIDGSIKIWS